MQIEFTPFDLNKPIQAMINKPDVGFLYLCEAPEFCREGAVVAEYTKTGFHVDHFGNIDKYVTGYCLIEF